MLFENITHSDRNGKGLGVCLIDAGKGKCKYVMVESTVPSRLRMPHDTIHDLSLL